MKVLTKITAPASFIVFMATLLVISNEQFTYFGKRYENIEGKVMSLLITPPEEREWKSPQGETAILHFPERYTAVVITQEGETADVKVSSNTFTKLKVGDAVELIGQRQWITGKIKAFENAIRKHETSSSSTSAPTGGDK